MECRKTACVLVLGFAVISVGVGCHQDAEVDIHEPVDTTTARLRPTDPVATLPRFEPGDVIETHDTDSFRIHFVRTGPNAVPSTDANNSGVPDYVELVGQTYEEVQTFYADELGFRTPIGDGFVTDGNGGDDRFDVYLVDFGGRGDGQFRRDQCDLTQPTLCAGHMLQENDFFGYSYPSLRVASRILGSHEYFHAIQAAYDDDQDIIVGEATAVWATEQFDPSLNDLEGFVGRYLQRPERSMNVATGGLADGFPYAVGLFFQFLTERHDRSIVERLWRRLENGAEGVANPDWFETIDRVLADDFGSSFADAFDEFAIWNLYTFTRSDPSQSYAGGALYPLVTTEPVVMPLRADRIRVFVASTRYYSASLEGRNEVTAALVVPPGGEDDLRGLRVHIAAISGTNVVDAVLIADAASESPSTVSATNADEVIAFVVNTLQEGDSRRPSLCLGTPAEVSACRADILADSAMDAGVGDGADAGVGAGDAGTSPSSEGGCQTAGRAADAWTWLTLLAVVGYGRSRFERRSKATGRRHLSA